MKKLFTEAAKQAVRAKEQVTKVLTVTILLTLGKESTTRDYEVIFAEKEQVNEIEEARKMQDYARRKYTSIMHNGGDALIFQSNLCTTTT